MKNGIASIVKLLTPSIIILTIVVGFVPGMNTVDAMVEMSIANVTGTLKAIRRKKPPMSTIIAIVVLAISYFLH